MNINTYLGWMCLLITFGLVYFGAPIWLSVLGFVATIMNLTVVPSSEKKDVISVNQEEVKE